MQRIQKDLGYLRVGFWSPGPAGDLAQEREAGAERPGRLPRRPRAPEVGPAGRRPAPAAPTAARSRSWPCRCAPGTRAWASWCCCAPRPRPSRDEDVNILATLAGQLAVAIQKSESVAQTEHMARQMATLYDLGLETSAAARPAAALRQGHGGGGPAHPGRPHLGAARLDGGDAEPGGELRIFAAWARDPGRENYSQPVFRIGEGIAGRVARDRVPRDAQRRRAADGLRAQGQPGLPPALRAPDLLRPGERRLRAVRGPERHPPARRAALHQRRPRVPDPLRGPALDRGGQLRGLRGGAGARRAAGPRQRPGPRDRGEPLARAHPRHGGAPHPAGLPLPRGHDRRCPTTRPRSTA